MRGAGDGDRITRVQAAEMHTILYYVVHSKNNLALDHFSCMSFILTPEKYILHLDNFFFFFKTEGKLMTGKLYLAVPQPGEHSHIWDLQDKM